MITIRVHKEFLPNMFRIQEATALLSAAALKENFTRLARAAGVDPGSAFAFVKANAYGHGAREVAVRLASVGAKRFAVARLSEAKEIREVIPGGEILILAPTDPSLAPGLVAGDFTQAVNSLKYADELAANVPAGKRLRIALAVDTGMGRLGFPAATGDPLEKILSVASIPALLPVSIYTHLPDADVDGGLAEKSVGIFRDLLNRLAARGLDLPAHFANSASILRFGADAQPLIREGIALYGYNPASHLPDPGLRPVMKLCAPVLQVRDFVPGETVGYCRAYTVEKPCRIALVGIGYADGFPRACTGGEVTINGAKCRIVGRISMDQTSVLLPDGLAVKPGDHAVLFGETQEQLNALADRAGTISYEILAGTAARVKRVWIDD